MDTTQPSSTAHARLANLVGEWEGTTLTWFEPGQAADESTWRGSIKSILGGRFVIHEYAGTLAGEALHGYCTIGYNMVKGQYEAAWVDAFHMDTGMMFLSGKETEHGFSVVGSYAIGDGQPDWGWRMDVALLDQGLILTAYNITPEGEEFKAIETRYHRA
jgi:hypothetical protein